MAKVFWFTGLSGSGKTTIALGVKELLDKDNLKTLILDGDEIRNRYPEKLGFTRDEISKNIRNIIELCFENMKDNDVIFVPVINPLDDLREEARKKFQNNFYLVYCNANLNSVSERDVKGLYQKAKEGIINDMIGFSDKNPYEIPTNADFTLDTNIDGDSPEQSAKKLYQFVKKNI